MIDLRLFERVLHYVIVEEPRLRARRDLGECAWTGRVDNTFGQPSAKA